MALVFPPAPATTSSSGVFATGFTGATTAGVSAASFATATSVAGSSAGAPIPAGVITGTGLVTQFFVYQPSFLIALIGSIFFFITMVVHVAQLLRNKTWYFGLIPQAALRMLCLHIEVV